MDFGNWSVVSNDFFLNYSGSSWIWRCRQQLSTIHRNPLVQNATHKYIPCNIHSLHVVRATNTNEVLTQTIVLMKVCGNADYTCVRSWWKRILSEWVKNKMKFNFYFIFHSPIPVTVVNLARRLFKVTIFAHNCKQSTLLIINLFFENWKIIYKKQTERTMLYNVLCEFNAILTASIEIFFSIICTWL